MRRVVHINRWNGSKGSVRFLGSGSSRGILSTVLSFVDPDRVTAQQMAITIKNLEHQRAKDKTELQDGLNARLEKLQTEQSAHLTAARKQEWYLALAAFALSFIVWWDDTWGRFEVVAVYRILRHQVSALKPQMYVTRKDEEARIAPLIGVPSLEYDVIIGPRGCGKSSVVLHVAAGQDGVATFSVANETDNAYIRIIKAFGISSKHYELDDHHQLVNLLKRASLWHDRLDRLRTFFGGEKRMNPWVPTIIVEIDHRAGQDTIAAIAKQLKIVASDNDAARVILLLSDANAQFALPGDRARQKVMWIHDLTEAESRALMEKHNFAVTEEEKQLIFRRAGTRVADLTRLIHDVQTKEYASVETAVNAQVEEAKDAIRKLLKRETLAPKKIDFKAIFNELLKSPTGVPVKSFKDSTGIPEDCGEHFKQFHAFSYYNPNKTYTFYSRAHYEAAKELRVEEKY